MKPDFLIVGAAKSGTTSLFNYLNQHPDIYIPEVKECRFFSQLPKNSIGLGAEFFPNSGITNEAEYFGLFKGQDNKVCGDISNDYLYYAEESIRNIKKHLGSEVKIIIILRNPIDRAYSNYLHAYRDGWEKLTFEQSIIEETFRISGNWAWPYHYVQTGFYYSQVKPYMDNFANVKVFLYEDLNEMQVTISKILSYLNIGDFKCNVNEKYNVSGFPKNLLIHRLLNNKGLFRVMSPYFKRIVPKDLLFNIKNRNLKQKPLSNKTRSYLKTIYIEDVQRLSKLIDRDLSEWVK